jgi:hypothetical protein
MAVDDPGDATPPPDAPASETWLSQQTPQVQQHVRDLRNENAKHRTANKVLQSSLGKLQDSAATIRKLSIDNALLQKGTADPKLIRFYLSEEGHLDDLDPSVDGWTTLLDDRVDDLLARRPDLKAQRSRMPSRSGTDGSTGGPGDGPSAQVTRSQLAGMSPEQIERALKDGTLNAILGRR